jgi:serine/threonine protein kinase
MTLLPPLLNALSAAHNAGVIHRDLKPANIFIVTLPDGATYPKLLDFGLARRGEAGANSVRQTSVGGTPLYIAPEQVRGESVSARTDLYSLGCVLYEVLTGQPPFRAGNLNQLIEQHLTLKPTPLRELAPDIGPKLEAVVLQWLEKRPEARPATAVEARLALEAAAMADAVPIRARGEVVAEPAPPSSRRRSRLAARAAG